MRPDYDPGALAGQYARLGAAAISVLTDREFFQGAPEHLPLAKQSGLPVLRKDFIISPKQILEAHHLGADAVLLIVRLLTDEELREYLALAGSLQMDALVEIHNMEELERAMAVEARIIGINHRNLDTLEMDLSLTEQLAPRIRKTLPDSVIIAESGVESRSGRARVDDYVDAILIGTALVQSADIERTWQELFGV